MQTTIPPINLSHIKEIIENLSVNKSSSYLLSYKYFLDYFKDLECIEEKNLVIWSFFVYGWMPTILKKLNATNNQSNVIRYLNKVKNGKFLTILELHEIKNYINNSIVWASKLLHFINPEIYPIWDSKVSQFLLGKSSLVNNVDIYYSYTEQLNSLKKLPDSQTIQDILSEKFWYPISAIRAIEFAIFSSNNESPK